MGPKKAIEILTVIPGRNPNLAGNEFEDAIKLGIEGLEAILGWLDTWDDTKLECLLHETKD